MLGGQQPVFFANQLMVLALWCGTYSSATWGVARVCKLYTLAALLWQLPWVPYASSQHIMSDIGTKPASS